MPSDEALRAAKAIRDERIRGDRRSSLEADAEIIDAEFKALRDRAEALDRQVNDLLGNEVKLADAEIAAECLREGLQATRKEREELRDERDKLRVALGSRGRHDCPMCQGRGTVGVFRGGGACECRKELFR